MKRANNQKWFKRVGSPLLFNAFSGLLLMSLVLLSVGCGQFNDYVVAPTIVDASDRPPYITSPVIMPQNEPVPIYPLPHGASDSPEIVVDDFFNSSIVVTAVEPEKLSSISMEQVSSATKSRSRRILYEYAPNHPDANEHGYIEIINPDYVDPSTQRPIGLNPRPEAALAVRPDSVVASPKPVGAGPEVTGVMVTGTSSRAEEMPRSIGQESVHPIIATSTEQSVEPSLSVQESEATYFEEKQVVAPVSATSSQTVETDQASQGAAGKHFKKNDSLVTPTVSVNSPDGLRKVTSSLPVPPRVESVVTKAASKPFPVDNASTTITDLQQLVRENPDDTQKQLSLRFLYLAYGNKEKALELFSSIPAEKQAEAINIVRAAMLTAKASDGAVETGEAGKPETASRALEALDVLSESMAEQTDLEVAHLEICQDQSVKGFGQYEPLAESLLVSGEPRKVQIYCELKHFKSQLNASGKYITQIAASIELIDEDYRTIYHLPKSDIPDVPSYQPRRDFFFRGQIKLPRLTPGKYEFVVKVEDKFAGKIARPFRKPFEVKSTKSGAN